MEIILIKQENKLEILQNFIKENSDLAKQGSQAWLDERKFIIGGSEISSIVGKNPYSNIEGLIAQKVGLTSFTGNTYTRWGNLFENVSELLFKTMFIESKEKIYATGSILHKNIPNHRYSPDGLCYMRFIEPDKSTVFKTTLLEFKSPYSSVPSVKVPAHYLPQVKAGLCTINIADIAIFNNNMFRKCSLKQLDFSVNYNNKYHRDTGKKLKNIDASIATGIIMFSISEENIKLFNKKYDELNTVQISDSYDSDEESFLPNETFVLTNKHMEYISNKLFDNDKFPDSESDSNDDEDYRHFDDGTNIMNKFYKNIALFQTRKEKEKKKEIDITKINDEMVLNMIDLGEETSDIFNQFLTYYKYNNEPSFIDLQCIKPEINKTLIQSNSKNFVLPVELNYIKEDKYLDNICKKYNYKKIIAKFVKKCSETSAVPIAFLPWKLLRSSNIIVEKDADYLNNIKSKIDDTINIIKDITNNSKSMDDTANLFEKHFTDNAFTKNHYENKPHPTSLIQEFL